jgi:hypothetical protein
MNPNASGQRSPGGLARIGYLLLAVLAAAVVFLFCPALFSMSLLPETCRERQVRPWATGQLGERGRGPPAG